MNRRSPPTRRADSYRILLTGAAHVADVLTELATGIIHGFRPKPWTETEMPQARERAVAHLNATRAPPRPQAPR